MAETEIAASYIRLISVSVAAQFFKMSWPMSLHEKLARSCLTFTSLRLILVYASWREILKCAKTMCFCNFVLQFPVFDYLFSILGIHCVVML